MILLLSVSCMNCGDHRSPPKIVETITAGCDQDDVGYFVSIDQLVPAGIEWDTLWISGAVDEDTVNELGDAVGKEDKDKLHHEFDEVMGRYWSLMMATDNGHIVWKEDCLDQETVMPEPCLHPRFDASGRWMKITHQDRFFRITYESGEFVIRREKL